MNGMSAMTMQRGAPRLTAAVSVTRKSSGACSVFGWPRMTSAAVSPTRSTGTPARSNQRAVVAS